METPRALPDPAVRPPERIELDGLLLRRYTPADAPALHAAIAASYEHLHAWMPWSAAPPKLAEQEAFIGAQAESWASGVGLNYGIFGRADGATGADAAQNSLLGAVGVHDRIGPGGLEIGYWLDSRHTGRGVMTKVVAALARTLFELPGIERIEIHCDEANERSAAVPRRLGYRLDRIEDDGIEAPAETGRGMVWVLERPAAG